MCVCVSFYLFLCSIQVNDQIIEVDGKSLVGVTQAYAASVLRGTCGRVHFLIGREKDPGNSEIAQLISQSIAAERQREAEYGQAPNKALPREPDSSIHDDSSLVEGQDDSISETIQSEECPPVAERRSGINYERMTDFDALNNEMKEWQQKCKNLSNELARVRDSSEQSRLEAERQLDHVQSQLNESDLQLTAAQQELDKVQQTLEDTRAQYNLIEKKYHKAKKLIKGFQQRELAYAQKESTHFQQLQDKDHEYAVLVRMLKDRIVLLEHRLRDVQRAAGLPVTQDDSLHEIFTDFVGKAKNQNSKRLSVLAQRLLFDSAEETTSPEYENVNAFNAKNIHLDIDHNVELLDSSAAKQKAGLASQGSLANRQPPTMRRQSSASSVEMMSESDSPRHRIISDSPAKRPLSEPNRQGSSEWPDQVTEEVSLPLAINTQNAAAGLRPPSSEQTLSSPSSYLSTSPNPSGPYGHPPQMQLLSPTSSSSPSLSSPCSPDRSFSNGHVSTKAHIFRGLHVLEWSAQDVANWLDHHGLNNYSASFRSVEVTGHVLLQLDSGQIKVSAPAELCGGELCVVVRSCAGVSYAELCVVVPSCA